ncbi:MAG: hypothetical protein KKG09_01895 [Verrucomicrobia bacterium]|nr:hypothetical protein [Verrucomicrobiota bacterium]MCG2678469.1 hypothetical protein [Kiritimatiellia bacterium]MBU4248071.1 hypothetical protein [Verrucomicrobiota bacterium]MBU4290227.1 hypothetical protein [Verrucomicrobiota bacterium]MBU4430216.1 hypothetical protein [Verrucomicrobiota bacterium]
MKLMRALFYRYWRPLLLGAWTYALAGLLLGRAYLDFLRPEFVVLLVLGLLVLLAFIFSAINARPQPFDIHQATRVLILILPLACLCVARGTTLDANAFQRRWTGMAGINGRSMPLQDAATDGRTRDASGSDEDVSLLYLSRWPKGYAERTIAVVGMLRRDPKIAAQFGTNTCVLFRFVMSCCAADAMPAAILVNGIPADWPESAWVRASGRFTLRNESNRPIPVLNAAQAEQVSKPQQPYLYWKNTW